MTDKPTISIYPIAYKATEKGFVSKPHSHKHYEIFFFEKGEATHFIDFVEYPISDNSLFLISYNQIHYITAPQNTFNLGFAISFDNTYFDFLDSDLQSLFCSFSINPAYNLKNNEDFFVMLFNQIKSELKDNRDKSHSLVLHYLKIILTHISRLKNDNIEQGVLKNQNPLLIRFLEAVEQSFKEKRTVAEYAQLLNITTTQLNRISQKNCNLSALSVIHNRVNLEAKRKLFYSDIQIKEICFDLGFEDAAHFNNFFKKINQQTPNEFRKSMSQIFN